MEERRISWLTTLQPLLIVLIKNSGVTLSSLELDNTNPHGPTVIRGRVLLYISHIDCDAPKAVGFLGRFGLKTGTDFAHFSLESGMVFEGTTGVYERI